MIDFCVGPLSVPSVVVNATLFSLFLFTRHGSRTPTSHPGWPHCHGEWHCGSRYTDSLVRTPVVNGVLRSFAFDPSISHSYPPSCIEGSLIDKGFDQMQALGSLYRSYLINGTGLLPEHFNPNLVYIRTSWLSRAQESALAFFQGLYPPESNTETLNITTGGKVDPLLPGFDPSDEFDGSVSKFVNSNSEIQSRVQRAIELYRPLFDHYNITGRSDLEFLSIADLFFPYRCGNGELSELLNDDVFEHMLNNMMAVEFGYLVETRDTSYTLLKEMLLKEIDAQYGQEKNARFTLFSAHDVTLVAILSGIGYQGLKIPPQYASHLAVEIWHLDRPYLRFVYNGEVVPVKGRELIPLSEYRELK